MAWAHLAQATQIPTIRAVRYLIAASLMAIPINTIRISVRSIVMTSSEIAFLIFKQFRIFRWILIARRRRRSEQSNFRAGDHKEIDIGHCTSTNHSWPLQGIVQLFTKALRWIGIKSRYASMVNWAMRHRPTVYEDDFNNCAIFYFAHCRWFDWST